MVKFFLERPVFAWVLALVTMMAGVLAIFTMPLQQYPTVAPPTIEVSVTYPGASASTVNDTVVQVIEQEMTGLDSLQYISSNSDSSGNASVSLTFALGTGWNFLF